MKSLKIRCVDLDRRHFVASQMPDTAAAWGAASSPSRQILPRSTGRSNASLFRAWSIFAVEPGQGRLLDCTV